MCRRSSFPRVSQQLPCSDKTRKSESASVRTAGNFRHLTDFSMRLLMETLLFVRRARRPKCTTRSGRAGRRISRSKRISSKIQWWSSGRSAPSNCATRWSIRAKSKAAVCFRGWMTEQRAYEAYHLTTPFQR